MVSNMVNSVIEIIAQLNQYASELLPS